MKKNNNEKGFSLVELLVVVIIIAIVAAIAIPNLLASRKAANEASAISSLRTYHSAESTYFATFGNNSGYATQAQLGTNKLVDTNLGPASGTPSKSGYDFAMTLTPTTFVDYCVKASPQANQGTYFYATSSSVGGVIYKANAAMTCAADGTFTVSGAPIQ